MHLLDILEAQVLYMHRAARATLNSECLYIILAGLQLSTALNLIGTVIAAKWSAMDYHI
jgi:hypothetical protein